MTLTSMYYLEPAEVYKSEKPYFVSFPVDNIEGASQSNIRQSRHDNINVTDVRGYEAEFTLDSTGFELAEHMSRFKHADFDDFDSMKYVYFEEIETFLKKRLQASWVKVFDCDIRRRSADYPNVQFGDDCQPVQMVHVDYSFDWGLEKARKVLKSTPNIRPARIQEITHVVPAVLDIIAMLTSVQRVETPVKALAPRQASD